MTENETLLQIYRSANSAAEALHRLVVERGLVRCPNCDDKHNGPCPKFIPSRRLDRMTRRE